MVVGLRKFTYGSPMTKESPALMDGTRPREPTSAAAASLEQYNPRSFFNMIQQIFMAGSYDRMSPYKFGATITSNILIKLYE